MTLDDLFARRDRLERAYTSAVSLLPCLACEHPFPPTREKLEEIEDEIKEAMK